MSGKTLDPEFAARYHEARTRLVATAAYHSSLNEELLKRLPPSHDLAVLDNMCGTGILLKDLCAHYRLVVGADISPAMLRYATTTAAPVIVADARRLPFADESFDIVVCRGGLHEIPQVSLAFAEIARVLRPAGTLLVLEPNDNYLLVRYIRRIVYRLYKAFDADQERGLHFSELKELAQRYGLSVIEVRSFGLLGYVLLCNADVFRMTRLISKLPGAATVARALARLDVGLSQLPGFRCICFQLIGKFAKDKPLPGRNGAPIPAAASVRTREALARTKPG
jgi:ubiquinone/menaquinone biosynthesis C-methylase UbiE